MLNLEPLLKFHCTINIIDNLQSLVSKETFNLFYKVNHLLLYQDKKQELTNQRAIYKQNCWGIFVEHLFDVEESKYTSVTFSPIRFHERNHRNKTHTKYSQRTTNGKYSSWAMENKMRLHFQKIKYREKRWVTESKLQRKVLSINYYQRIKKTWWRQVKIII